MRPSLRLLSAFTAGKDSLTVPSLGARFPYRWLRDACQCPACVHPSTRQKLHRTTDAAPAPAPAGITEAAGGALAIRWASGHTSHFDRSFLARHAAPAALARFHHDRPRVPWDRTALTASPALFTPYDALGTEQGLLGALTQLADYGLLFVRGVPTAQTSNGACELRALAGRFGELRTTFYGETWDVNNIRGGKSRNIAYTNLDLGLHMDLLYFQHPPRFQILHCLRNRVRGGASYFVDALAAAHALRAEDPAAFDVLARTPVAFHYINDGHHLHCAHPTLELDPFTKEVAHVNYSPPFQAPLALDTAPEFYGALEAYASVLDRAEGRFEYLLKEGDAVLFDNRRVLHARREFSDDEDEGEDGVPNRWLKGCYLEADAIMDRGRVLRAKLEGGSDA